MKRLDLLYKKEWLIPDPSHPNFNPEDLKTLCHYLFSGCFIIHGGLEHYNLEWDFINFGNLMPIDLNRTKNLSQYKYLLGRRYTVFNFAGARKTLKLSLNNQLYDKNKGKQMHISNPVDLLDAVKYMETLKTLCHPKQVYVYHQIADKSLQEQYRKECGLNIIFNKIIK